ncbi:MAG: hypothetical protein M3256_25240, partial [Actinomycetota bacterium]|nr:hypothetical protein [Actinomycetota bacterium]
MDAEGYVLASAHPTARRRPWRVGPLDLRGAQTSIYSVACPSERLCVVVGGGNVFVSTDPLSGARSWHRRRIDGADGFLAGISCPSVRFCAAVDDGGNVLTEQRPARRDSRWHVHFIDRVGQHAGTPYVTGVACSSAHLCVVVDGGGVALTSTTPGDPSRRWSKRTVEPESQHFGPAAFLRGGLSRCIAVRRGRYRGPGGRIPASEPRLRRGDDHADVGHHVIHRPQLSDGPALRGGGQRWECCLIDQPGEESREVAPGYPGQEHVRLRPRPAGRWCF